MSTPNRATRGGQPGSASSVLETSYLSCPEGRIGYDVAGDGALVVLVPGMGDLRAGYRFLAPGLRAAGYRVACTDLRGHGDSDATFTSYGDEGTVGDVIALRAAAAAPAYHHHDSVADPRGRGARRRVPGVPAHAVAPG